MAEKCTKTSSPVERWMNPYPFAPLNHFTVPFSLTKNSFRRIAKNYSCVSFLFALFRVLKTQHPQQGTPSKRLKNLLLALPRAGKPHRQKPLLCISPRGCPRRDAVERRRRRRDIALLTQKRNLLHSRQPGPASEAPDNSRKIPVGKREVADGDRKLK